MAAEISDSTNAPSTQTTLSGVSPPTTAAPNTAVTGTTFDGCASVTDAEVAYWELDPATKHDSAERGPIGRWNVRGCLWDGEKWYLRVYAVNGSISDWEQPQSKFDRQEKVKFGSREGWIGQEPSGCTAAVPSQGGIAAVQVDLVRRLEREGFDACPLATKIMTTIEPRIP